LGSHAIGGFKLKNGTTNWFRDFLPEDIPQARLLAYGYDSSLAATDAKYSIGDLAKTFLDSFLAFRDDTNTSKRPIIFIGHSLGGLLIKEVCFIVKAVPFLKLTRHRLWQSRTTLLVMTDTATVTSPLMDSSSSVFQTTESDVEA
jgi:hypothetical protein